MVVKNEKYKEMAKCVLDQAQWMVSKSALIESNSIITR